MEATLLCLLHISCKAWQGETTAAASVDSTLQQVTATFLLPSSDGLAFAPWANQSITAPCGADPRVPAGLAC